MPASPTPQPLVQGNLARLVAEHEHPSSSWSQMDSAKRDQALRIARKLPLVHATDASSIGSIFEQKSVLSPRVLDERGIKQFEDGCAEDALKTDHHVCFYCGQFRYPVTNAIGFILNADVEQKFATHAEATPFDSGALHKYLSPAPPSMLSGEEYFQQHRLPVSDYRELLGRFIGTAYREPLQYISNEEPSPHPHAFLAVIAPRDLAISDPLHRRWTYEVRLPDEVPVLEPAITACVALQRSLNATYREELLLLDVETFQDDPWDGSYDSYRALQKCAENVVSKMLNTP